ncbi:hypothetical protein D6C92_00557 [Aureobasidium pullulans]|nr:hypothetical protein D6C92_00557 [Aureobasidium pullulans]
MGRNVKVRATKACDYCRLRKIKCIASEAGKDCQACTLGELDCSYIMPNKRRGPPPKRQEEHSRGSSRSDIYSAINFGDRKQPDRPISWWQLILCVSNVLGASARFLPKLRDNYATLSGCPLRTYASSAYSDIRVKCTER